MNKTAFVTGASGFIGVNLVKLLCAEGWEVTALHRERSDITHLSKFPVKLVKGDICEDNISFAFHGKQLANKEIQTYLQKKFFGRGTFVHKEDKNNSFIIICKNQTCSDKMKTIEDIKKYLIKNSIN